MATRKDFENSEFWMRKIRTSFYAYDTTKEGVVSIDSIILLAKRFGEKCPERADEVMKIMTNIWTVAADGNRGARLDMQGWIDTRLVYSVRPDAKQRFRTYSDSKFNVIDLDLSNFISKKEFRDYFECMGIDTKHAAASFDALNTNGDGIISREEFLDAAVEWAFGLDETHPSQLFYGPLVGQ